MEDKKELNLEETEKVSGGMNPTSVSPEEWEKIMKEAEKNHLLVGSNQNLPIVDPEPDIITGPGGVMNPKPQTNEPPKITLNDSAKIF